MVLIVLVTAAIGFGAIEIHNLTKQPETQSETVVIPAPLAANVDAAYHNINRCSWSFISMVVNSARPPLQ